MPVPPLRAAAVLLAGAIVTTAGVAGAAPAGEAATAPTPEGDARLSRAVVPATGTQVADVEIGRFGRYALSATSAQGTAIQLVDRMAGPGEVLGEPGRTNGRVDAFLERGAWRIRAISDDAGTGEARIAVRPFTEVGGPRPALLPDLASATATLADLEQRSWWVQIDADEDFAVELAGRSLADVRLWRDGQWLEPATPTCDEVAPEPGRPLRRCTLATRLGAGLWQLVAYGGPALPWSQASPDQPLHVRRGIPTLADAGRLSGVIGPFGTERWLVPGRATAFRLELPTATDAAVSVRALDATDPFRRDGTFGRIQKETLPPMAEVNVPSGGEGKVVTVSGAAGQAFTLQHFPPRGRATDIRGAGLYLVTTLHGGDPLDRPDVTGLLVDTKAGGAPVSASLIPLAKADPYRRKFNLFGSTTLLFDVGDEGTYHTAFAAPGVKWRWEPLLLEKPKGYAAPELREGAGTTELTRGRWALTLVPDKGGVTEVVVRAEPAQVVEPRAPRASIQMLVNLEPGKVYRLVLNEESGASLTHLVRKLPAELDEALPLVLGAGEVVQLPVTVPAQGALVAPGLEVAIDGGAFAARQVVAPGLHQVTVRNAGTSVVQAALAVERDDRSRRAPLPELPDTAVTTPPPLPSVGPTAPRALDLAANGSATYALDVPAAGLYRMESTGLLATAGAVRTRTRPVLASAAVNGVGRNFLLQTYLREGDYQVTVGAQGASAGHLGLRVAPTPLRDGGALRAGVPARATLAAGEGVAYRFDVAEAGEHVLRAFGLGRLSRVRLEDAEGWPVIAPDVEGDLRLRLAVGSYRLVVLPEAAETRRIVTFDRVPDPVTRTGHGPFALALDAPARHVWWEPAEGAERVPDTWTFALDADADVTVSVDAEMAGELVPAAGGEALRLVPGRASTWRLARGTWRLTLVNARRNSGVPYAVRVTTRELVAGLGRDVQVPATVAVSAGGDALYEIDSMGLVDVSARLYDASGALVAQSDDRPDDWNFRVLARLAPGPHTLRLEPVGEAGGRTRVTMRRVEETDAAALVVGTPREMTPGTGVLRVPLPALAEGVLAVSVRSAENVGLAVEKRENGAWRALAEDSGPRARVRVRTGREPADLRVRVTSLDGRGLPVTVRADLVTPRVVSERALAGGVTAPVVAGAELAAVVVERAQPGALELETRLGRAWCPAPNEACGPVPDTLLATDSTAWLLAEGAGRTASFRGVTWTLGEAPGRVTLAGGRPASVSVAPAEGPVLVFARSEAGEPGVAFAAAERIPTGAVDGAEGRAVAVALDPGAASGLVGAAPKPVRAARVFRADGRDESAEIELRRVAFATPTLGVLVGEGGGAPTETPKAGTAAGALAGGAAWRARLPGGDTRVVLAEGLVAVLSRAGEPVDVIWAADAARDVSVESGADMLTVLNPTEAPAAWSVTVAPLGRAARGLRAGAAPVEVAGGAAGRARFDVVGGPGQALYVRGAEARVWGADGRVATGDGAAVPGAARVEIVHGAGPWAAWVAPADQRAVPLALWGGGEPDGRPRPVTAPARVALAADVEAFVVATRPGVLRVEAGQAVVARVMDGDAVRSVVFAADGVVEVPVVAAGRLEIALRAVGGGALRGAARVALREAEVLSEGLGAEAILGAGEARAWRFDATRDGTVGVGVRTPSAAVSVALYGPDGAPVGDGVVQMPALKPGSYLVVATAAKDAPPTVVRPVVVGLTPPDTGPPEEVVREYLVAAGLLPADPVLEEAE